MKQLIKHILKEQSDGLSKIELYVFKRLKSNKENPYTDPLGTYKYIESMGFDEEETKQLFVLFANNFKDNVDYETLKNIDRSDKLNDQFFPIMFDNIFDVGDISWTHPYEYFEDGAEGEDPNRIEFYTGDYEYGDNTIFRWYGKDYWDDENKHNRDFSPMVELEDLDLQNNLMEMFGESWMKPFMEWIKDNFDIEVKHIAI